MKKILIYPALGLIMFTCVFGMCSKGTTDKPDGGGKPYGFWTGHESTYGIGLVLKEGSNVARGYQNFNSNVLGDTTKSEVKKSSGTYIIRGDSVIVSATDNDWYFELSGKMNSSKNQMDGKTWIGSRHDLSFQSKFQLTK